MVTPVRIIPTTSLVFNHKASRASRFLGGHGYFCASRCLLALKKAGLCCAGTFSPSKNESEYKTAAITNSRSGGKYDSLIGDEGVLCVAIETVFSHWVFQATGW